MKKVFRSTLVHIILLGCLLAILFLLLFGVPHRDDATQVVITDADVEQVLAQYIRTWQRQPTASELRGHLEKYVREEVLYREALKRGLSRNELS